MVFGTLLLASANLIEQLSEAFELMGAEWVLWLLLVLSVASVAVMIERAIYFATHSTGNIDDVSRRLSRGDLQGAVQAMGERRGMEAEVVREAVSAARYGPDAVEELVQAVISRERRRYERFLSFLGTLGANAPFIGLFGTVLGIINAFSALAKSAQGGSVTSGSSNVMNGISEALVATAVGLLVALPAVAAYNIFMRWLKTVINRSDELGYALASHLKALPDEAPPAETSRAAGAS